MKMSNTLQRRVILDELCKLTSHPTAEELFVIVRKRLPKISLGTVYRNLKLIAEAGQILKLEVAGRNIRFDGNAEEHPHLCCTRCGAVEDVDWKNPDAPLALADAVAEPASLRIRAVRIEYLGLCEKCVNLPESEEKRAVPDISSFATPRNQ